MGRQTITRFFTRQQAKVTMTERFGRRGRTANLRELTGTNAFKLHIV